MAGLTDLKILGEKLDPISWAIFVLICLAGICLGLTCILYFLFKARKVDEDGLEDKKMAEEEVKMEEGNKKENTITKPSKRR
jgi:phosphotransferase system  glucose/maltose/N-acetylglucosamine-specific IIC component